MCSSDLFPSHDMGGKLRIGVERNGGYDAAYENDCVKSMAVRFVDEVSRGRVGESTNMQIAIAHVQSDDHYTHTTTHRA